MPLQGKALSHLLVGPLLRTQQQLSSLLGMQLQQDELDVQGNNFPADLQCRFSNQSQAFVVNATVHSPRSASCSSPAWNAQNNSLVSFTATSTSSDCVAGVDFAYYLDPQVSQVAPLTGPRYGSFDLRVQLDQSVASFADTVSSLEHISGSSQNCFVCAQTG